MDEELALACERAAVMQTAILARPGCQLYVRARFSLLELLTRASVSATGWPRKMEPPLRLANGRDGLRYDTETRRLLATNLRTSKPSPSRSSVYVGRNTQLRTPGRSRASCFAGARDARS